MTTTTADPGGSARMPSSAAVISMMLFVVRGEPPDLSSTALPWSSTRIAAQPPGPGLPWQAPSVQIRISPGSSGAPSPSSRSEDRAGGRLFDLGTDHRPARTARRSPAGGSRSRFGRSARTHPAPSWPSRAGSAASACVLEAGDEQAEESCVGVPHPTTRAMRTTTRPLNRQVARMSRWRPYQHSHHRFDPHAPLRNHERTGDRRRSARDGGTFQ